MLASFTRQTITVKRPSMAVSRGSKVADWTDPTTITVGGCSVQPLDEQTEREGRAANEQVRARLIAPPGADIRMGDRVEALGETWEVESCPPAWPAAVGTLAHRDVTLRLWRG